MITSLDRISAYLKKVPSVIDQRGRALKKEVLLLKAEGESYHLKVKGTYAPYYFVTIDLEAGKSDLDAVSCSCEYAVEHAFCKHIAASLHFLYDYLLTNELREICFPTYSSAKAGKKPKSSSVKVTSNVQPIVLPAEAADEPGTYLSAMGSQSMLRDFDILDVALKPDELILKVKKKYDYFDEATDVSVVWKENSYWLSCKKTFHKKLCEHIQVLAGFLQAYKPANLLTLIPEKAQREFKQRVLKEMGVENIADEEIHALADIHLLDEVCMVAPKGRLQGLSNPQHIGKYLDSLLHQQVALENKLQLILPADKPRALLPGFVVFLDLHQQVLLGVKPICGKPNKNKDAITAHYAYLNSPFEAELLPVTNLPQAYFLAEQLNAGLIENIRQPYFKSLQELFSLLPGIATYFCATTYSSYQQAQPVLRKFDLIQAYRIITGIRLFFRLWKADGFINLKAFLRFGDKETEEIDLEKTKPNLYSNCLLVFDRYTLGLMNSPKEGLALSHFLNVPHLKVVEENKAAFLNDIVQPLAKDFPIEFEGKNLSLESVPLEIKQRRLYVGEHQQYVTFRPTVLYDNEQEVNLLDDGSLFSYDAQGIQLFERDYDSEQSFVFLLESLHPNFKEASQQTFYSLRLEDMKANFWFLKAFEMLREQGVHIFGLNELKNLNYSPHTPSISIKMGSSQDWFETKLEVAFGNTKVKIRDLKKAVKAGNGYIELSDGSLGILPEEWLKKFERLFRSGRISKEKLHIPKTNFNLVDEFIEPGQHRDIFREIEEKKARLREFKGLKQAPVPRGLKASLRHYQQEGLNWLNFLSEFGWGGILADDMGLGKTLQAIALICQELELRPDLPNLVVAPTTLLFNWRNELDKFAPKLDYIIHHGQRTQTLEELSEHKLILTSYGVLINDLELLNKLSFNIIIADESQAFKNVHSKRYQSIVQLKGRLRLALTGTPIENNLFELYAQMNFANPAFFVDMASFRENYVKPIQQDNNEYMREELKKKISPFLLRRTKQEVLRELPEKTEDYLYCGMGAEQRRCYDAYRNEYRDYLLKKFDEEGVEKSQMYVLEGLTRLRQICDAPQLVDSGYAPKHSAKLQELLLHVQEKTGRHKMLVFSQYVKMLQLVEQEFKQNDIAYAYLDGQTSLQERERQVQYFQENTECRVFLISLKAGGSGLNLTAADYVYLLDPWWNPAVESQAIDRCYRMGQDKKVMAYRMICQDTVEEKIIALQQKKKQLSDDVLGGGDSALSKLSREDILELFS